MKIEEIKDLNEQFRSASAQEILKYFADRFGDKIGLASSLGAEDQVLTEMLVAMTEMLLAASSVHMQRRPLVIIGDAAVDI